MHPLNLFPSLKDSSLLHIFTALADLVERFKVLLRILHPPSSILTASWRQEDTVSCSCSCRRGRSLAARLLCWARCSASTAGRGRPEARCETQASFTRPGGGRPVVAENEEESRKRKVGSEKQEIRKAGKQHQKIKEQSIQVGSKCNRVTQCTDLEGLGSRNTWPAAPQTLAPVACTWPARGPGSSDPLDRR